MQTEEVVEKARWLEGILGEKLQHLFAQGGHEFVQPTITGQTKTGADSGAQCPHMDAQLDASDVTRRVVIWPMTSGRINVYPQSHNAMLLAAKAHKWTAEHGYRQSSEKLDEAHSLMMPFFEPLQLQLNCKQVMMACMV